MNINQGMWAGNAVKAPEFKFVGAKQTARCKFRMAVNDRRRDADGVWQDGETVYVTVTCWRSLAEHVVLSLNRGDGVLVAGKLTFSEWDDKEGARHSAYGIDATTVGIDLSRHIVQIKKSDRTLVGLSASDPFADGSFSIDPVTGEILRAPSSPSDLSDLDDDLDDADELVSGASVTVG